MAKPLFPARRLIFDSSTIHGDEHKFGGGGGGIVHSMLITH